MTAAGHIRRRVTKVPEIRTGDTVIVLTGKDAGKRGTVERVVRNQQGLKKTQTKYGSSWAGMSPLATTSVVVEGLNIAKRHTKPRPVRDSTRMGGANIIPGGIIEKAVPLDVSNVMLVCPTCRQPTRVGVKVKEVKGETVRVRVCKRDGCGQEI